MDMYCYELWGNDTFSNETYICGTYIHYSSAWRAMKKLRLASQETQESELRDTFWIVRRKVEEHAAENESRQERIRSVRERMHSDMEAVMRHVAAVYLFARDAATAPGTYEYPLPEDLNASDIDSICFIVRCQYRSRTKYEMSLYVKFSDVGECVGVTSTLAWGTLEEIRDEMQRPETALKYAHVIFDAIRQHYCSIL